ncbi:MAG: hypothetical protein HY319_18860 [Armatimonadetes bacterium]|nr:hypothetical protein [Armatimonadota bacterium]
MIEMATLSLMFFGFPAAFLAMTGNWLGGLSGRTGGTSGGILTTALGVPLWVGLAIWGLTGDGGAALAVWQMLLWPLFQIGLAGAFASAVGGTLGSRLHKRLPGAAVPAASLFALIGATWIATTLSSSMFQTLLRL